MTRQSRISSTVAVVVVTCLTALALLVPAAPAARDQGDCRLPAWTHVLTGHWGEDCR